MHLVRATRFLSLTKNYHTAWTVQGEEKTKRQLYHKEYSKTYYETHKQKVLDQKREYYQQNKDRLCDKRKESPNRTTDPEKRRSYMKEYAKLNKEKVLTRKKEYALSNPTKVAEQRQKFRQKKKTTILSVVEAFRFPLRVWYQVVVSLLCRKPCVTSITFLRLPRGTT